MLKEIPTVRPQTPLLDTIDLPDQLRPLSAQQLNQLADELRAYLMFALAQVGGHCAAGLGVIELTIVLHWLFDTPRDRLIWDIGHQAYPHKLLTGRRAQFLNIRQSGGLSGFLSREESVYDVFGAGHSSTSISAALGMALSLEQKQSTEATQPHIIAVIGDGALTAGMAFEALNHVALTQANILIILNDNDMSISNNTGALREYFLKHRQQHDALTPLPQALFEAIGIQYTGPIDGHDFDQLIAQLQRLKKISGPRLLHIITQKGKGFEPAEADPIAYHALKKTSSSTQPTLHQNTYSELFGQWLCDTAKKDQRLVAITPAMAEGSHLVEFAKQFPTRYQDVGIAEQHAVTCAAGFACGGMKPVLAIYSTFLQRAYDQLIHDVALQNLDVTFAVDRAGFVGADGPTHAGAYDLSFLNCIPNLIILAPSDAAEMQSMLQTAYDYPGPALVRYPKGTATVTENNTAPIPLGIAKVIRQGEHLAILSFGHLCADLFEIAESLNATLVSMRFIKPLDHQRLQQLLLDDIRCIVTVEENAVIGGAGTAVTQYYASNTAQHIPVLNIGIPDQFISQGSTAEQRARVGLDKENLYQRIHDFKSACLVNDYLI